LRLLPFGALSHMRPKTQYSDQYLHDLRRIARLGHSPRAELIAGARKISIQFRICQNYEGKALDARFLARLSQIVDRVTSWKHEVEQKKIRCTVALGLPAWDVNQS
jgi:hypothetical protein